MLALPGKQHFQTRARFLGALYLDGQRRLIGVAALDIAGGQITSISSIVNPDKLAHLGSVGDLTSLLRSAR
jgi:hypothetical protein